MVRPWTASQCLAMKRQALLDCIQAAKERYPQAWARTSVDLAIQVWPGPALGSPDRRAAGLHACCLGSTALHGRSEWY